jgi:hypothetical protein
VARPWPKGNKYGRGSQGQLRRDLTIELISQLNELDHDCNFMPPDKRLKLNRIVRNLIERACHAGDEFDEKGNLKKPGSGDLAAILAIFDRLEGRPAQRITGSDDGPVQLELRTVADVRTFLMERGIDVDHVPPPTIDMLEDRSECIVREP